MRMRSFGQTGLEVSEYGLGTWAMGGGVYGVADDSESIRTIHRARDRGLNLLDTAPMYGIGDRRDGRAEEVLGRAVKGERDKWIIATKFGRHLNGNDTWWQMTEDFSGARAIRSVEESLMRMQTDYIDVLFVHSPPSSLFDPEDAFSSMVTLKEQGKIRFIGFSFWEKVFDTLPKVEPWLRDGVIDAVQVKISLLVHEPVGNLLPVIRETGTAFVAREALAQGFLTDSFTADGPFVPQDFKAGMAREEIQKRLDKANSFRFLVDESSAVDSLPAAALNWTLSFPEVSCVIPGSKSVAELDQCLEAEDAPRFSREQMQRAREIQLSWTD